MNIYHEQYSNSDLNSVQVATPSGLTAQARSRPSCPGRDLKQADPGGDSKAGSRHRFPLPNPQAKSRLPFQVATSWTTKPGRDTNPMSRHQFPTGQVATSVPCHDLLKTNLCRDIKSMSRPPTLSLMSRHQIHVATPFLPTVGFPGCDA